MSDLRRETGGAADEPRGHRLKRLRMRAMRRGIKEMDIILSRYAEAQLAQLDAATLDRFDALLCENDQDLYQWVTGQSAPPEHFATLISDIAGQSQTSE